MQYKIVLKLIKENKEVCDELLNSTEWKDKQFSILQRDNFRCRKCGSDDQLQVHQKYYLWGNALCEYHNDALITLCDKCHNDVHKNVSIPWKVYIGEILTDFNFTPCDRCYGTGWMEVYYYHKDGICLQCGGLQYQEILHQYWTKKSDKKFITFDEFERPERMFKINIREDNE